MRRRRSSRAAVVIPLYPPGSPFLKVERVKEPEVYNMMRGVAGRIQSIVNIHNPSIEIHPPIRGSTPARS